MTPLTRSENLLGAASLALADRLGAATEAAAGNSGAAPAALTTLLTYGDRQISIERLRMIIGLSHSATVRLVDRLSAESLVTRKSGADGRERALRLTSRGRRVARRIRDERARVLAEFLAPLDQQQRRELELLLVPLLARLVQGRREARHICRLCDHAACQAAGGCPVDEAATTLGQ
jgi:MarR family transcriptional regulator, negative regulator of the multidrug operon emrRAB